MSKEVWIGKKGFRYWYYKFRDSELYSFTTLAVALVICFVLLVYWILPELNNWFSIRNEVIATRSHIAVLQQNITFMNNLDKNTLNQQLEVSTNALPAEKDFGSILNAISNASANSGVSLNDYSFQVGNIASPSAQLLFGGLSSLQVVLVVSANTNQLQRFIQTLQNSLPISDVISVDGNDGNVSLTLQFFQKPFPTGEFSPETPITPLSPEDLSLLQKLTKWQDSMTVQNNSTQTSSGSASMPLF
jgi:hypothetical protein